MHQAGSQTCARPQAARLETALDCAKALQGACASCLLWRMSCKRAAESWRKNLAWLGWTSDTLLAVQVLLRPLRRGKTANTRAAETLWLTEFEKAFNELIAGSPGAARYSQCFEPLLVVQVLLRLLRQVPVPGSWQRRPCGPRHPGSL